jgi:hypothetical protein
MQQELQVYIRQKMEVKKRSIRKNIKNDHQNMAMVKVVNIVIVKKELINRMIYFPLFFFKNLHLYRYRKTDSGNFQQASSIHATSGQQPAVLTQT